MRKIACTLLFCSCFSLLYAQQWLQATVSVEVKRMPLDKVLEQVGQQAHFYFSYNSTLIRGDSLITLSMRNRTVKEVLDRLFGGSIQYQSSGRYLILQAASPPPTAYWYISGYISDAVSGNKISNASVYERQHLAGTITNEDGFFRLRLKDKYRYPPSIAISISRIAYADTFVMVHAGQDEQLSIGLLPVSGELSPVVLSPRVERNWLARLFLSSSQTVQSLNLRNFFAYKPFQVSFIPGLGTHGKLGSQVVNKLSVNLLGGYTAGSKGLEMAGLFNIDKKEVKYVQLAGLFNVAGANAKGVQMAGLYNHVQDSVNGLQAAGLNNRIRKSLHGVQLSGIYNSVSGPVRGVQVTGIVNNADSTVHGWQLSGIANRAAAALKGVQIAGIANTAQDSVTGVQISGIANHVHATLNGTQITGIVNYARHVKGTQIGLINISDTLSGYSIGLLTIAKRGYHKFSVAVNDVLDVNLVYKAGNRKLYSMISLGFNIGAGRKAYSWGYGFGNETRLSRRLLLTNELTLQQVYVGSWETIPDLARYQPALHWQLGKLFTLHAGPCIWLGDPGMPEAGYAAIKPHYTMMRAGGTKAWVGWQLGLQLF
jgi:hypothetical protein